jgi:cytochrome P450
VRGADRIPATGPEVALPPGPNLPVGLQTLLFMAGRAWVFRRWQRRFGNVFAVHIAPAGHGVVIAEPAHIREIFAGPADTFHAGEGNAILEPVMGRHSVLLLDEDEHLAARKRVMSAFHGAAMGSWSEVIEAITAERVASWPRDTVFAVHPELNAISLEVILRIVFGVSDQARLDSLRPLLTKLVRIGPVIFLGWTYPQLGRLGPWRRFGELNREIDRLLFAEIAERRSVHDLATRNDVLSRLLGGRAGAERCGGPRPSRDAVARRSRDNRCHARVDPA